MPSESEKQQQGLGFDEANAGWKEKRNELGIALLRAEADLFLAQFVLMVFNVSERNPDAELKKTYRELAARPWGLCCSVSKARSTVELAEDLGLVTVTRNRYRSQGQEANSYRIEWSGIRDLVLGLTRRGASRRGPPASTGQPPASTGQPPASTGHPSFSPSLSPSSSESESEEADRGKILRRRNAIAFDALPPELAAIPELAAAFLREVAPLPPADLVYGIFTSKALPDLRLPTLVIWFRRQLAAPRPALGGSEAELLLAMAAAQAASDLPREQVLVSRRAIFQSTVSRGIWHKVTQCVPTVREYLDGALALYPRLLLDPEGTGAKAQEAGV